MGCRSQELYGAAIKEENHLKAKDPSFSPTWPIFKKYYSQFQILVEVSPFPFTEVSELREKYTYNITPWSQGLAVAKRGLKILYR